MARYSSTLLMVTILMCNVINLSVFTMSNFGRMHHLSMVCMLKYYGMIVKQLLGGPYCTHCNCVCIFMMSLF